MCHQDRLGDLDAISVAAPCDIAIPAKPVMPLARWAPILIVAGGRGTNDVPPL
jgi:hypothetical protein